jgi:hypothetical protein
LLNLGILRASLIKEEVQVLFKKNILEEIYPQTENDIRDSNCVSSF